ncbi:MAG: Co2+/Mg2+ efflux protein ApaG [Pseudomonadales bacterium]|nr:Co2+/Mg2+ efflux protein ApaG [Pseudomonadales bacterium]
MSSNQIPACGIDIHVSTHYLAQQSNPANSTFAFSYTITITNRRLDSVRLLSRHWIITDQNNHVERVEGSGVVGQQPVIHPAQSYQYTSGAVLKTATGDMRGAYAMVSSTGEKFDAPIPLFILAAPHMVH